jgi:hypothetical protein|tara:strand:- start:285 stop:542 length:258 start_codon:yes stop_codon:yes gene_type:complete
MAIHVGLSGTTVKTVAAAGSTTQVKKVVVGTPVRRVTAGAFHVTNIGGIDITGVVNGSVLVYNESTTNFEAKLDLEEQNINGGSY